MTGNWKKWALIGVAVAAVVVGVVVAVTSGGGSSHNHSGVEVSASASSTQGRGDVAVAAGYLGISRAVLREQLRKGRTLAELASTTKGKTSSGLVAALVHERTVRVEKLAAEGKLSKQQEQAALAAAGKLEAIRAKTLYRKKARVARTMLTTSSYLRLSAARVRAELASGRSLAEIAEATPGKSKQGLIDAITNASKQALDRAVKEGTISSQTASKLEPQIAKSAARRVERKPPKSPPVVTK